MLMCSTPERITAGLRRLIDAYDGPVGGYPNIGYMPLAPVDPDKPTMTNQLPSISGDFGPTLPDPTGAFREWKETDHRRLHGHGAGRPQAGRPYRGRRAGIMAAMRYRRLTASLAARMLKSRERSRGQQCAIVADTR